MLFTIVLFFLSISLAFAMIARKVWQIRAGKLMAGSYEEADWHDISIESIRARLLEIVKFTFHHFVLFALKVWILISNGIKHTDRKVKKNLTRVLDRNGHFPKGGKPSGFLKDVRRRKEEVAIAIEKEGSDETVA